MTERRMFPPGTPISPSGWVIVGQCGRVLVKRATNAEGNKWKRGICWWCAGPVAPPGYAWCSSTCIDEASQRHPSTIRHRALARDAGKPCATCGGEKKNVEVDHIVPIVEGGHPWSLDNLRCICERCHRFETRCLAARRAAERRAGSTAWQPCERRPGNGGRPQCLAAVLGGHEACGCERPPRKRRAEQAGLFTEPHYSETPGGPHYSEHLPWHSRWYGMLRDMVPTLSWWARRRTFERIAERRAGNDPAAKSVPAAT